MTINILGANVEIGEFCPVSSRVPPAGIFDGDGNPLFVDEDGEPVTDWNGLSCCAIGAVCDNDLGALRAILATGLDVNATHGDYRRQTLLEIAAAADALASLGYLLQLGAVVTDDALLSARPMPETLAILVEHTNREPMPDAERDAFLRRESAE